MVGIENLTMEGLKVLLIITIVVLGVAMTLIGYFMSKRDSAITQATDNLTKAVNQLETIVNGFGIKYDLEYGVIKEQLKAHRTDINANALRIEEIDKDLNTLKTKHEMIHCKYD